MFGKIILAVIFGLVSGAFTAVIEHWLDTGSFR